MKKIYINDGQNEHIFALDQYKLIIGENYHYKYEMIKSIRSYYSGLAESEYSQNKDRNIKFEVNDNKVNVKKSILFDISPSFDLQTDLKIGSKSITLKYIETILNDSILFDSINTINALFESLQTEINLDQDDKQFTFNDINTKVLLKFISASLIKENDEANIYDLTYEEMIIFIIKMIRRIIGKNIYETITIILDVPILTTPIFNEMQLIKDSIILIFTNNYIKNVSVENILVYANKIIDFADDITIHNLFYEENNVLLQMEELKKMIKKYVDKVNDDETKFIRLLLE